MFTFTIFFPGLPNLSTQSRFAQNWYTTVQMDLKYHLGTDSGGCYEYSLVNNSLFSIKAKTFAYWFIFLFSVFGTPALAGRVQ